MKNFKITKLFALLITAFLIISCSGQKEKKADQKEQNLKSKSEAINQSTSDSINVFENRESSLNEMSMEEALILDMMITEYERNAEDLINWANIAEEVRNSAEANAAMLEYIEVQKRLNENTGEIKKNAAIKLGEDHKYSAAYEAALQAYLNDPQRMSRAKNAVNATMKLIDQYGDDPKFTEIMKQLEEMNRYRMKELQEGKN